MQAHRAHQHSHRVLQIAHATAAYTFMAIGLASGYSIPAIMPVCALAASAAAACMLIDIATALTAIRLGHTFGTGFPQPPGAWERVFVAQNTHGERK